MQIAISTAGIVSEKFPKAGVRDIVKAGYSAVVLPEFEESTDRERVFKACEAAGLEVIDTSCLLTNQTKVLGGHHMRGKYCDAFEAAQAVDTANSTNSAGTDSTPNGEYGFNLDVGKANLCGLDMQYFISTLGPRLKMVTICDNDGNQEASMLPFTAVYEGRSRTDWLGLIRGLRAVNFDGYLVMRIADTASAFSPIIRPELLKFSTIVADYIAWQIKIESVIKKHKSRVLFGAGNMCRAYMKCYGEAYPPLFTCDNNKKLWNTQFCGLEVKPPEYLKELPEYCAVFICNIYYSEIERQLRDMGLKNPIERFNDEYLPNFHFDRI